MHNYLLIVLPHWEKMGFKSLPYAITRHQKALNHKTMRSAPQQAKTQP